MILGSMSVSVQSWELIVRIPCRTAGTYLQVRITVVYICTCVHVWIGRDPTVFGRVLGVWTPPQGSHGSSTGHDTPPR